MITLTTYLSFINHKDATVKSQKLQANLDEANVKHKQEMADKQKAHASAIAKKNAAIQGSEKEKQDYIKMHYELVDEVDGLQKCSEDTLYKH